jgi:hypothetical protein
MSTQTTDETKQPPSRDPASVARYWQMQLGLAERDEKSWRTDAKKVVERYRAEKARVGRNDGRKLNILWSNTETLRSALYARPAKPYVQRKFQDADPVGREVATIVERALIDCSEEYDAETPVEQAVQDLLLAGRGIARIVYEPVLSEQPMIGPDGRPVMDEAGKPQTQPVVTDQKLYESYDHWEDFRQSPARTASDVWWRGFRHLMDRDDLRQNQFDAADRIPLNWSPTIESGREAPDDLKRAEVWEIWHKPARQRIWIVDGYDAPLRVDDDPYNLRDFWPLPEPLQGVTTTETLCPVPEFRIYQDQADDLDEITARISRLTKALKRRGVYDASVPALRRLANAGDNEFIATDKFQQFAAGGGLKGSFETEDLSSIVTVLTGLYEQRDKLVEAIYELTGISDIMRGASDASETAAAQQIKAQFGSLRLQRRQRAIQRWIRDLLRIKAEIIAEHFEPAVLQAMTGQTITPQIMQVLRDDKMRSYRIDIETDSTIFTDAQEEQASRTQLVEGMTQFIVAWGPVIAQEPALLPLAFEMLTFAVRAFKDGRELEDVIEQTKQQLEAIAQQKAANPQPNPQMQIEQAKLQGVQAKTQAEGQKAQADVQKSVIDLEAHRQRTGLDMQRGAAEHQQMLERMALERQARQEQAAEQQQGAGPQQ